MIVEEMDFIVRVTEIVDMEEVVEDKIDRVDDMIVDMAESMVFGKIVDVGFHKHNLTNLEKVGFGFAEEANPTKS